MTDDLQEERREAEADGFYDAWCGYAPDPSHLGNEDFEDDYMEGYEDGR